jgi:apolipoprotein D and lipocalin family protein
VQRLARDAPEPFASDAHLIGNVLPNIPTIPIKLVLRRIMRKILYLVSLVVFITAMAQTQTLPPLEVVPSVDLSRYAGTWHEIARLPNRFQSQCVGEVTATYTLLDDGQIKVVNRCKKADGTFDEAEGRAKLADADGPNTKLKVRFAPAFLSIFPFVWGNYWIIDLDGDYTFAVIGEPERKYFWVLSRTPALDEQTFQRILERAKAQGYDLTGLIRTKQTGG